MYALWQVENDPMIPFHLANLLDPLGTENVERDLTSPLQFFDLRILDDCGRLSEDEYP